jgi:endonuclease-3
VLRIEFAIRTAGLQKQKARAIKQLALRLVAECDGDLTGILKLPFDEARVRLTKLPKVGPKTADVVLLTEGRKTISVDTHVERVSKRLGFTPGKASYEVTRQSLMRLFNDSDVRDVPSYFMALGRRICKARKPRCPVCPVESLCIYKRKTRSL